jgi:hypothetical protein
VTRPSNRRPLWQVALLLPLFPFYIVARKFVDWMDNGPF